MQNVLPVMEESADMDYSKRIVDAAATLILCGYLKCGIVPGTFMPGSERLTRAEILELRRLLS